MQVPVQPDWLRIPGTGRQLQLSDPLPGAPNDGMGVDSIKFWTVSEHFHQKYYVKQKDL